MTGTRTQVVEDLLHYGQHKASDFGNMIDKIVGLEIQSQDNLLQIGPKLGWTPEEMAQIEKARSYWLGQ